jgi:Peptidase MA superfamily
MRPARPLAALLALLCAAGPAAATDWQETTTPHYLIKHETAWLPAGLTMGVEHVHFRLMMDLGMFSNWASDSRITFYLYKNQRDYVRGRFSPPTWSNGLAIYAAKAVAIPQQSTDAETLRILAHETTHVIFVNYFREEHRDPPNWVNEGLAMLEENSDPGRPELSRWYQAMVRMDPKKWFPLDKFLALSPIRDLGSDKTAVAVFYIQAYSITNYLLREHSHLQFKAFCDHLRDGMAAPEALKLVYHYDSLGRFEKDWLGWVADPAHRRAVAALPDSAREAPSGVDQSSALSGSSWISSGWFDSSWKIQMRSVFPSGGSGSD